MRGPAAAAPRRPALLGSSSRRLAWSRCGSSKPPVPGLGPPLPLHTLRASPLACQLGLCPHRTLHPKLSSCPHTLGAPLCSCATWAPPSPRCSTPGTSRCCASRAAWSACCWRPSTWRQTAGGLGSWAAWVAVQVGGSAGLGATVRARVYASGAWVGTSALHPLGQMERLRTHLSFKPRPSVCLAAAGPLHCLVPRAQTPALPPTAAPCPRAVGAPSACCRTRGSGCACCAPRTARPSPTTLPRWWSARRSWGPSACSSATRVRPPRAHPPCILHRSQPRA